MNTPPTKRDPGSAPAQAASDPAGTGPSTGMVPGTSTLTTRALLQVVAGEAGQAGVDRVLARAGLRGQRGQLQSMAGRISYPDKLRLFEAAAAELGDPGIGRRLGPALVRDPATRPLLKLGRAQGSPAAAFSSISRIATRLDSAAVVTCQRIEAGRAVLARRVLPPFQPSRIDCDYNLGLLAEMPRLFGLPAATVEHDAACQLNGSPECIYRLAWTESGGHRLRRLLHKLRRCQPHPAGHPSTEHRLQLLEGAAEDLAGSTPLEVMLDRIAARADSAVHAPGHLLAVRLPTGGRHVRVRGLGGVLAAALGNDGVTLPTDDAGLAGLPVLSVPVASAKHFYGVLAVAAHPGQEFFPEDTATLAAYARHAAAGLDIAEVVAEAREERETAQLLLDVSRRLAEHSSVGSVARSIADAVPAISGADRSAVALWDADAGKLRIAGMKGWHGELEEKLAVYVTTARDSPELSQMLTHGTPLLVDPRGSAWARQMLADFGLSALAAVPIMVENQLAGIVLAHWARRTPPESLDGALTERLTGLACLAAVALDKSRLLEEAQRQALHDPLTGLPNRALLEDRLETALAQARRDGRRVGVLFCDVNRFKRINDSLGHGAGDRVLCHVAVQLGAAVRSNDTVARYSGDEFVILLPDIATPAEAEQVAARVRENLAEPVEINGGKVFIDVAIGTGLSGALPPERSGPQAARQLIEEADLDMYRAKARVRGRAPQRVQHRDRLRLETDLRGAAGRGELRVHFQPQVDLATNRLTGAEALVRWQHPELGLLSPAEFIPLAEESHLIGEVGAHVLAEACRAAAAWRSAGYPLEMAVNISAVRLGSLGFTERVRDTLEQAGLPASALTLEVTESQVVAETSMNDENLHELRALGVGISVDDFGTGYSSLARLHQLPVTEVKIDMSFTARLGEDGYPGFVAGIVGLGHGLGLRVVAEGVETAGQLDALRAMGCDRAQGFLLGKPLEAPAFEERLRAGAWQPDGAAE